jgi:predicted RNase H-like HicB family nuclease
MVHALAFTARFTPVEKGQVQATIDELPNVITAGRSREEAKGMLGDALHAYLLALGDSEGRPETPPRGQAEPLFITVSI